MSAINHFSLIFLSLVLLGFVANVNGWTGVKHFLGKQSPSDTQIFYGTYGVKNNSCRQVQNFRCYNNETHFSVHYKLDQKKFCISAIQLISYPDIESTDTKALSCQKGGIGTNECFLVFKKDPKQTSVNVEVFGSPARKTCRFFFCSYEGCSLKNRYIESDPFHVDAYGLPYEFDDDEWTKERTTISKEKRSNEVFFYKDGLFNRQISYLEVDDKFSEAKELTGKDIKGKKKFSVKLPNAGDKRISFLDIYWFQESSATPKYPYIYYNGHCEATNKTCELIFDTDEQITYALVKVFTNPSYNGPRLRENDLGRS
uniref:Putative conserved secreted protein n=1 Tax=Nyssomyia neivai TaxID=330878 RepID=A0A1L8DPA2_9DIPT